MPGSRLTGKFGKGAGNRAYMFPYQYRIQQRAESTRGEPHPWVRRKFVRDNSIRWDRRFWHRF
jgi:hypothetical protein